MEHDEKLKEILDFAQGKGENDLIEVLHKVQNTYDHIPRDVATILAHEMHVPLAKIFGVATFYTGFTLNPKGKYQISVCMGTACYVKGGQDILDEISNILGIGVGETTEDLLFSIIETRCVGDCAGAPIVTVNDKVYRHVVVDDVKDILGEINKEVEEGAING